MPKNEYDAARWVASHLDLPIASRSKGDWLVFNNRWHVIPEGDIYRMVAERITLEIDNLKSLIPTLSHEHHAKILEEIKVFNSYLQTRRLRDVIFLLSTIVASHEEWDAHNELFPCANRIINLEDGSVRHHTADDFISYYSPVEYLVSARCPRWEQFILEVMNGDQEMSRYLQRAVGYSLTGLISEQVLFILFGSGANGKNIFLEVLYELFGSIGHQTTFKVLERAYGNDSAGAASPHLAALSHKRYVMASESQEGSSFNDGLVKSLTGDGKITARQLYKTEAVFENTAKIWLACNNMPKVYDVTPGFWRRLHIVPFTRTFGEGERDQGLKETLLGELSGILNWALEGAREWYRLRNDGENKGGLRPPQSVLSSVGFYRSDSDPLAPFLDECCVRARNVYSTKSTLYAAYLSFVRGDVGTRPLSRAKFYQLIKSHGHGERRENDLRVFEGLCLKSETHHFPSLLRDDLAEARVN